MKVERYALVDPIIVECIWFAKSEVGTHQADSTWRAVAAPTQGDCLAIIGNEAPWSLVTQLEPEA